MARFNTKHTSFIEYIKSILPLPQKMPAFNMATLMPRNILKDQDLPI